MLKVLQLPSESNLIHVPKMEHWMEIVNYMHYIYINLFHFLVSVHSFIELAKTLLEEGAEFILSEKFSQDPIEEYFGKQRMRLGCNENPNLNQYNFNALAINVAGDNLIRSDGNTRGKQADKTFNMNDTALPPCKKKKHSL